MIESKDFGALGYPPDVPSVVDDDGGAGLDGVAEPEQSELEQRIDSAMREAAYTDGSHPGHKKAVEAVHRLFERRAAEGDPRSAVEKVCGDALEQQSQKQDALVAEAQKEMNALVGLGFDEADVPDDIMPHQVGELKMQRLAAESKNEELQPIIERTLADLQVPPDVQGLFGGFCRVQGLDEGLRQEILERVIWWIHGANKKKFGAKNND